MVYPDEIGPSDSASKPRTSNQQRPFVEAPRPEEVRRLSFRRHVNTRAQQSPPSEPPESVDSHEEIAKRLKKGYRNRDKTQRYQDREKNASEDTKEMPFQDSGPLPRFKAPPPIPSKMPLSIPERYSFRKIDEKPSKVPLSIPEWVPFRKIDDKDAFQPDHHEPVP